MRPTCGRYAQTHSWTIILLLVGISAPAAAQNDFTNALRVKINGTCHNLPKNELIVVLNGNEDTPAHLTPLDNTRRDWEGVWHDPDLPSLQFPAIGSSASARLRGYRTDCRISDSDKRNNRIEAVFTLDCDHNPTSDMTITISPLRWRYARFLRRTREKARDCDCDEKSGPIGGTGEIWDVRLRMETIRVGFENRGRDLLWMHLDDLKVVKDPKRGSYMTLGKERIGIEIVRSTPKEPFGSNAYDVIRENRAIKPDTTFTIKVH